MSARDPMTWSTFPSGPDEAAAAVAHDLRLPLSHIKGFVSALRRTDVEWDAAARQDFLAEIEREADRIAALVESLLDSARTSAPGLLDDGARLADPAVVVDGALDRVRGLTAHREVRRHVSTDLPLARLHREQMERVLVNLLQNAIKYTPTGTPIDITARLASPHKLEFRVEDRGPGVPEECREQIFQPFYRCNQTTNTTVPGHGLGLAICHSIVLAHGGRMLVEDRTGGGASFSVLLPLPISRETSDDSATDSSTTKCQCANSYRET